MYFWYVILAHLFISLYSDTLDVGDGSGDCGAGGFGKSIKTSLRFLRRDYITINERMALE